MTWLDAALLSAFSAFLVMSFFSVALPPGRPERPWAGVGLAWLVVFVVVVVIGLTNLDKWSLDCAIRVYRTTVTSGIAVGQPAGCSGANDISLWVLALPPTLGVLVLLGWVWRHTTPGYIALRVSAVLVLATVAVLAVGQLDPNLALLAAVVLVLGSYVLPWIRDAFGGMNPRPGAT